MSLVQIAMIWGAASAALFSFPAQSGEWENFQALKEAMVRSSARRDVPLPAWASSLDYKRSYHFWDLPAPEPAKPAKQNEKSIPIATDPVVQP